MATDIGIPICGVVGMTGSETIPDNFMALSGGTVDEERSPLNGVTLPDWNQTDTECIPTQCSPYDGTVYSDGTTSSITITEGMIPETEVEYDISCTLSGSSGTIGEGGSSTLYSGSDNMFTTSIFYSDYQAGIDEGSDFGGSDTKHMKMDDDTSATNLRLDNHSHTTTLTHTTNHDIVASSASNTYISSDAYGYRGSDSGSKSLTVGSDSSEEDVEFPTRRNTLDIIWYMRIY